MKFLSLDLEMNQPSGHIIQIGACCGDLKTGEVLGTFSQLVKINEPLNPFIVKLCGITDEVLQSLGTTLPDAYQKLLEFRAQFPDIERNPIVWGGGDSQELQKQLMDANAQTYVEGWPFGRRWLDVKTVFQFNQIAKGQKKEAGLAKALTKVGLNFQGRKHWALDDAVNTFRLAHHLLKQC